MSWYVPNQLDTRYMEVATRLCCCCCEGGDKTSQNIFPSEDSKSVQEASSLGNYQTTMTCFPLEMTRMKGEIGEDLLTPKDRASSCCFTIHHDLPIHVCFLLFHRMDVFHTELYSELSSKQLHSMGLISCKNYFQFHS